MSKDKREIENLLKTLADVVILAKKKGIAATTEKIKMLHVEDISEIRKKIISIIFTEVCQHFKLTQSDLQYGRKYIYDNPRTITYQLLYNHADMTIIEIANYFNVSDRWVQRKLSSFKKLNKNISCDKELLLIYDEILKKVSYRISDLENNVSEIH
jgi:hypothetical protein